MSSLPRWEYFVPFYGVYRIIKRIRRLEVIADLGQSNIEALRSELEKLRTEVEHMKNDSFKEVQFYEARIETIYQRIMQLLVIDPSNAAIGSASLRGLGGSNTQDKKASSNRR